MRGKGVVCVPKTMILVIMRRVLSRRRWESGRPQDKRRMIRTISLHSSKKWNDSPRVGKHPLKSHSPQYRVVKNAPEARWALGGDRRPHHCSWFCRQLSCVLSRGETIQRLLRSLLIVLPAPGLDNHPGVIEIEEPVFVQAFVAVR